MLVLIALPGPFQVQGECADTAPASQSAEFKPEASVFFMVAAC